MKRYKLKITPNTIEEFYNSLVDQPAIETNFIAFNKEEKKLYFKDEMERKITGPFMIPNKDILRLDKNGEYYMVYFTKESIDDIVKQFAMNDRFNSMKADDHTYEIKGLYLIENWIVGENDKIYEKFNKNEIPQGSWVGTYYVESDEIWNEIMDGKFKGFSIEGIFNMEEDSETELREQLREIETLDLTDEQKYELIKRIIE